MKNNVIKILKESYKISKAKIQKGDWLIYSKAVATKDKPEEFGLAICTGFFDNGAWIELSTGYMSLKEFCHKIIATTDKRLWNKAKVEKEGYFIRESIPKLILK